MNYGISTLEPVSFSSALDRKGRALISAPIRRTLGLRFGSPVKVYLDNAVFETAVDERGRFSVPVVLRKNDYITGSVKRLLDRASRGNEDGS